MNHSEVVDSVTEWIHDRGYKLYAEEFFVLDRPAELYIKPDLVAREKGVQIGIECKGDELDGARNRIYEAFGQVVMLRGIFPAVYLATSSQIIKQQPFFMNRALELGVGILTVDDSNVHVLSEPRNTIQGIRIAKKIRSRNRIDRSISGVLSYWEPMKKGKLIDFCSSFCECDNDKISERIDNLLEEGYLEEAKVRIKLG